MSAIASLTQPENLSPASSATVAIERAENALAELFGFCERLHRAHIQHDPHSCVICFEQR